MSNVTETFIVDVSIVMRNKIQFGNFAFSATKIQHHLIHVIPVPKRRVLILHRPSKETDETACCVFKVLHCCELHEHLHSQQFYKSVTEDQVM